LYCRELLIITNNPQAHTISNADVLELKGDCIDIIAKALHMVSQGHKLLSHPLSGSIKPNQSPYKSLVLTAAMGTIDEASLQILHKSLSQAEEMRLQSFLPGMRSNFDEDFQAIDHDLLVNAVKSIIESG